MSNVWMVRGVFDNGGGMILGTYSTAKKARNAEARARAARDAGWTLSNGARLRRIETWRVPTDDVDRDLFPAASKITNGT